MIKLIVAMDEANLIGKKDKMPWHIKEEFEHFRKTTIGHALLFGKTTFLGLPGKLENRKHYVFSRKDQISNADETIRSEKELLELFKAYKDSQDILFIAGGKYIYEHYYQYADELIISRIKNKYEGDVYLNLDLSNYFLMNVEENSKFTVEFWLKKSDNNKTNANVISWDEYFMMLANVSAMRSKDPSTQVGACIVNKKKYVIGLGYNGMPKGLDNIFPWDRTNQDSAKTKYPYVVHAEINAILNTSTVIEDCTLYTNLFPCSNCAKTIVQSGIVEVVYEDNKYEHLPDNKISTHILKSSNIKLRQHKTRHKITEKDK
ncbi:Bifunctional protein including dihydrofolate reductase and deoxycytidylate deaminase family domains [Mycoplasmoides gallisepticum CA06_2006.052-5-2P]|uniref:dihydrofolate reductase n=2 Tax=Mycoplasmoides gallisepticum TaxID=2096 RepID=Q7NC38_MYCGA|nr:dihydrofolate reductase [Mycoplasmoides gallisepticum]AAD45277.1 dihydrofolate reductase/deoxycytidylate deaminase fusion protein [Mycoplasmoides gallisepticum]AAP56397.2 Bifunctional protein including dihydrofolate reductase and deoxycytidylate deaminase family domains [Mycoplasmoides gallisepticum str. R(low)]ADC30229.1 Bifunctional protein including dihydrofolate reductase and deoxycytidylate deaminase family domains [Mycoplasmoides gallisepticum str. R(high)]ADC30995.1 Bifunctional prote